MKIHPGVIGVDEVGRGAWAGPLVVGAVRIAHKLAYANELKDSKLLSKKRREELAAKLRADVLWSLGWVDAQEIDQIGLTAATTKAMLIALAPFKKVEKIIVDGKVRYLRESKYADLTQYEVGADTLYLEVQAAAILAKVARDAHMREQESCYPRYGFEQHVGYGTRLHREALQMYGPCPLHRLSYKPLLASNNSLAKHT